MPETITGEALYGALLQANPDLAYTWRDLNTYDRQIYIEVACILNRTYLAPLQGELACTQKELRTVQDADRETFNKQSQQIQALQELAQWQSTILQECHERFQAQYLASGSGALTLARIESVQEKCVRCSVKSRK